jgi:integrase
LLLLGIDPKIVSNMLGHSSVTITQNLYQHVMPEMQRGASDALVQLLFPDGASDAG